jgi:arylsulfatase A-like enzyme
MLLAVLLCAALDTLDTRLHLSHRPQDWLLPLQVLTAWGALALLVAWPASRTARRLRAGFSASLLWLAGPVILHHALAASLGPTRKLDLARQSLPLAATLVALLVGVWLAARLERSLVHGRSRWPAWLILVGALLTLMPHTNWTTVAPQAAPATRAGDPDRPNLLLIVWDTTRADRLSPWGHERATTPGLAALAERSLVFERCWSPSVFTLSSHTSMLTGLPPSLHGTSLRRQVVSARTIVPLLAEAGYRTGAVVGTSVLAAGHGIERGFELYDDRVDPPLCDSHLWAMVNDAQELAARHSRWLRFNGQPHWFQDFQRPAGEVLDAARAFLAADDGRPWFLMINLFDAHWPYLPDDDATHRWVRPYDGPLDGYLLRGDDVPEGYQADGSDKAHIRDLYDAELWALDRDVTGFLAALDLSSGRTCLLVTADHGEALGEGDQWSHEELHAAQTHVPMLVLAPGRHPPGGRVGQPVSGTDVARTLLDLAGLAPPETLPVGGLSLLSDEVSSERILISQDHDNVYPERDGDAVIRGRYKLLHRDGSTTLHDTLLDPLDENDLSADLPGVKAELEAALEALLAASEARQGAMVDADTLRALGYTGY